MKLKTSAIDDAVLGLLYLTLHNTNRAWKNHDFDTMDRLHEQGLIERPAGKAKSVVLTEEGLQKAERIFMQCFVEAEADEK